MFVFARYERDLWVRVSYAGSGQASWWIEEFSRGTRFSRTGTERKHSVLQSIMRVQGQPIGGWRGGGLRSPHEICVLV